MCLEWRPAARDNLHELISYIRDRNPAAAAELLARINSATERLVSHPYLYQTGRVSGTRELVAHPNYVVVYRVLADAVDIVTVPHARQEYP